MCCQIFVLLEEGVCYDQCIFLAKLYQSLPCFIPYSKAKFACYSRYLLTSYFAFQSPIMKRTSFFFFLVLVLKVLQVFIELFNFSFFNITGWGIDLDYCDIEWFALETNRDHSFLRLHPSTAFQTLLLIVMPTPFLLRESCPQQQI